MINGVVGKGMTVVNENLSFSLTNADIALPIVTNVTLCNTTPNSGTYTFSIMDSSETEVTSQDQIFIDSDITANETIDLGNYILSPDEIIVINANISGIAVRVTGVQQPN